MKHHWVVGLVATLGFALHCHAQQLPVVIESGSLRVEQQQSGWLITKTLAVSGTGDKLAAGDVIQAVDGTQIANLNPISAVVPLLAIGYAADFATVIRNGRSERIRLRPRLNPVASLGLPQAGDYDFPRFARDSPAPAFELPDTAGKVRSVTYGPGWTLLHFWTTACSSCWLDVAAINEITNPLLPGLTVTVIAVGDTPERLAAYSRRDPLHFGNLFVEHWDDSPVAAKFPNIGVPTDILIEPAGHVEYVGVGGDSLRSALIYWKNATQRESSTTH